MGAGSRAGLRAGVLSVPDLLRRAAGASGVAEIIGFLFGFALGWVVPELGRLAYRIYRHQLGSGL